MQKRFSLLVAVLMFRAVAVYAEGSSAALTKADYYFRHGAYRDAVSYYEQIAAKTPRRKDAVLHAHMGDCYRLMKAHEQAAHWYAKALTAPRKTTKEMRLHYAEVLMALQQYDSAAGQLRIYTSAAPADRRAANMLKGCQQAKEMMAGMPGGTLKPAFFNTDRSDIAPAIFGAGLVFTTDSVIGGAAKKDKWTGQNYFNMYKVACNANGDCSGSITPLSGKLNTKYHDGTPAFTKDGRQMYFTRTFLQDDGFGGISGVADNEGTVHLAVMIAEDYDTVESRFRKISEFPFNDKNASSTHPAVSPDGSMLIFASDRKGGEGAVDLYVCRKSSKGEWEQPKNLGRSINTEGMEMYPVFLNNQTISFASDGHPGLGGLDVFYSSWNDATQTWSTPVNAGIPVNSSWDDMSLSMREDGRHGYFASNRPSIRKSENVYQYLHQKLYLNARILDSATGNALNDAEVVVQTEKGTLSLKSDQDGYASGGQLYPQTSYRLSVRRKGYEDASVLLTTDQLTKAEDTLRPEIRLLSNAIITYSAKILDEASGEPVENPMLVISKDGSRHTDTVSLATGLALTQNFEPGAVYRINAVKENYYSDEKIISTKSFNPENGTLIVSDTLLMCKLSVGAVCQIENILYDFDKATIRADAMTSLDKVIKLLHEHPNLKLRINSHTDCRGTYAYNQRLSDERAATVVRFLVGKGIPAARLKAQGFGATVPVYNCGDDCANCPEEGRQRNRRTEFSVLEL